MSDRYKFRGKRVDNGEWVYGGHYKWNNFDWIVQKDIWEVTTNQAALIKVDSDTVGQYTGHPNELWGGDKVRRADGTEGVIVWFEHSVRFRVENEYGQHNIPLQSHSKFEVIGTIHDKEQS